MELFRQAGLDFEALKAQARTPEFQAVELPGATFDASYALESDTIQNQTDARVHVYPAQV